MAQTTKTAGGLGAKLKARLGGVIEECAATPVRDVGFQRLPGGIVTGIAELVKCEIVEYDQATNAKKLDERGQLVSAAGELYWRAEGVVLSPETVNVPPGTPGWAEGPMAVRNLRTSIMINLFRTRSSTNVVTEANKHADDMINMMKLLAWPNEDFMADCTYENLEEKCAELCRLIETEDTDSDGEPRRRGPYFKFSTSWGKPKKGPDGKPTGEPLASFENWYGAKGVPADFTPDAAAEAEDDTAEEVVVTTPPKPPAKKQVATTAKNGAAVAAPPAPKTPTKATPAKAPTKAEPASDRGVFSEFGDLDSLATAADTKKDKEARLKIQDVARSVGITDEDMKPLPNYKAVVEAIKARQEAPANGDGHAEAKEDFVPKVGDAVIYRPVDKDDEPTGEEIHCEVTKVSEKFGWANLTNLEDGESAYEKVDLVLCSPTE